MLLIFVVAFEVRYTILPHEGQQNIDLHALNFPNLYLVLCGYLGLCGRHCGILLMHANIERVSFYCVLCMCMCIREIIVDAWLVHLVH